MTEDPRAIIAREPMHPRQLLAIGVATALNALDGFDVLSISFAAPGISKDWGITRAALGLVLSMELIGMGFGALILGGLSDRVGRRPMILACLGVMALGMGLASTAHDIQTLSIYRLFTGVGIGGMLAATAAITAECSNARRRNLAVSIMAGGYPMGAVVGGIAATMLLAQTGRWQSVFQFGAIATLCFVPIVLWLVPETIAFLLNKRPAGALDRINRTMVRQGRAPLDALPPADARVPGFHLAQLFAPGLRNVTVLLTLSYFAHMMTFYFLVKWIPKIVVDLGFEPAAAGGVLVWTNVGSVAGTVVVSLLTQRFGVRLLTIVAMVCGAVMVGLFGQGLTTLQSLSIVGCICGFFTNGAIAGLYAVIAQSFPASVRGGGTGLVIGVGRAGAALGPILAGLLFAGGMGLSTVAVIMASSMLVAAIFLGFVRYRESAIA